jgi:signal transduction histidine kinase
VRKICTELRPGILDDLGLVAALEWQAGDFARRTGIVCDFASNSPDVTIAPQPATAIFRICQETLTNVMRHANATAVSIHFTAGDLELTLEVRDNGKGPGDLGATRSFGLVGMRERAAMLGGTFAICGAPAGGTTVTVTIPRKDMR